MTLSIGPADAAHPDFFGEVHGIDLRQPASRDAVAAIEGGMDRFAVLVFHDQHIDDAQQIAFTRNFGTLEQRSIGGISTLSLDRIARFSIRWARNKSKMLLQRRGGRQVHARRPGVEVEDISNLDGYNHLLARNDLARLFSLRNMLWHTDSSFKPTPAKYSLLHARIIPPSGGDTEFADMRAAYDALDDEMKATIQDLICEHSNIYSREMLGFSHSTKKERAKWGLPVPQRLVRRHPVTGRRSLFLASHAGGIIGWPMPEARILLRDLTEHATQRGFVHAHKWRQYDLVMWDNRVTMHRGRRYDVNTVRELHRTTVTDIGPTLQQAA
jgi:alpha-ketoglutarate-dependent 2,4-dichlorophenoxyacetate dioxygenase